MRAILVENSSIIAANQVEIISKELPSLPFAEWKRNKDKKVNLKCGEYPSALKVPFHNTYWQTYKFENLTAQLYGAYYDNRTIFASKAFVRLYVMIDAYLPNMTKHHCQLWFDEDLEPVVAKVFKSMYSYSTAWECSDTQGGYYEPYLLSCLVPTSHQHLVPTSVTLVANPCDKGTNHLRVTNERPPRNEKTEFAICVRNAVFPFEDMSVRYVEWIETQLALGASKIYFYVMDVHPNIGKVFDYYEQRGKVQVLNYTFPSGHPRVRGLQLEYQGVESKRTMRWEVATLNDCYYRNMYKHDFIAMIDPDEVLMPKQSFLTWHDLFQNVTRQNGIKRQDVNAFNFVQTYFLKGNVTKTPLNPNIPDFMYMMQHTQRIAKHSSVTQNNKCFHSTSNILLVHNHFPLECVGGWCNNIDLDNNLAQLNHYRRDCHRVDGKCDVGNMTMVTDMNLWKHRHRVTKNTVKALEDLGFLERYFWT
jgi:Glycosyltransferase family 92